MKIVSPILRAALNASNEFRYTSLNVSIDNKLGVVNEVYGKDDVTTAYNEFWNDETAYCELVYVEGTFRESGHINCDERDPGMNFEHKRLKNLLKQFGTPELRACAKGDAA